MVARERGDPWLREFGESVALAPTANAIARRRERRDARSTLAGAIAKLLVFALAIWALFTWVLGLFRITGGGMEPTAGDGDLALTSRVVQGLQADDVVVYQADGGQTVGRVIAQPGDTVEVTQDGELKINGATQPAEHGLKTLPQPGGVSYPLTLGEGEYFVLADGRESAQDSRTYGPIGINEVEGKVVVLLRLRGI